MDFLQDIVKKNVDFLEKLETFNDLEKECDNYLKEIDNFLITGNIQYFTSSISGKENVEQITTSSNNKRKGRQKKPALADITELNVPVSPVHIKKEKISNAHSVSKDLDVNIVIKKEAEEMPAPTKLPPRKKKIKSEQIELPKRSTRSRTKTNSVEIIADTDKANKGTKKSSDVIIQNTTITTIDISDSEKDTETESEVEHNTEVRTTRSKTRKPVRQKGSEQTKHAKSTTADNEGNESDKNTRGKRKKRARSQSAEEPAVQTESKKSKSDSNSEKECNGSIQTDYEDAVSSIEVNQDKETNQNVNATFVTSSKDSHGTGDIAISMNSTVVVENPKIIKKGIDHDEVDQKTSETEEERRLNGSPEPVKKAKGTTKQIFSPYENTPLKKKVEAFEKLGVNASIIPMRVTRTKKKLQKNSEIKDNNIEEKPTEKDKCKAVLTPIMSRFQPKGCSTSKINKLHPHYSNDTSTYNESLLSAKSASALKASQAEFREREKRRQEKEKEALKKREALLQAQTEEKRKKREEKQQKAQQQREILEKEKQKQLEAQRVKEEKYKQVMAEREEKLQKQKEEAEKRRLLAKKKAEMQREEEIKKAAVEKQYEMAKLAAIKQKADRHHHQSLPVYMFTKPPLLPTDDCYDSDDPEYQHVRRNDPYWSKDPELGRQQRAMIICGETIKNSFFCRQAHTPDLTEIFEHIDPSKLKRTSSAIWRKPPRYTLMPTFDDQPVFSEESD